MASNYQINLFASLEAVDRSSIKYNDIFHPAPTKMKKFRKGNNKKKRKK